MRSSVIAIGLVVTLFGLGRADGAELIDFWMADGNAHQEDHLVKYNSNTGVSTVQLSGSGWPSDLVRVGAEVYGVDTALHQLYTLNPDTGVASHVGVPTVHEGLGALAYDATGDVLYGVDWDPTFAASDLISFDRQTGAATVLQSLGPSMRNVHGLAFRDADQLLYAVDVPTNALRTIDPSTGAVDFVATLTNDPFGFYDELTFFDGKLYGSYVYFLGPQWGQVRRIDLGTGNTIDIGPPIANVSAHSLVINSVPEPSTFGMLLGAWCLGAALIGRDRLHRPKPVADGEPAEAG